MFSLFITTSVNGNYPRVTAIAVTLTEIVLSDIALMMHSHTLCEINVKYVKLKSTNVSKQTYSKRSFTSFHCDTNSGLSFLQETANK